MCFLVVFTPAYEAHMYARRSYMRRGRECNNTSQSYQHRNTHTHIRKRDKGHMRDKKKGSSTPQRESSKLPAQISVKPKQPQKRELRLL